MKKYKNIFVITLSLLLLVGCNSENDSVTSETTSSEITITETTTATTEVTTTTEIITTEEIVESEAEDVKDIILEDEPFGSGFKHQGVEYGQVEKVKYFSTTANRDTNVNILLPAGYSEDKEYPVLYVLHGFWGNEDSMPNDSNNKIPEIIGNLIYNGEAKEMIAVFPYIYTSDTMPTATAMDLENSLNYDNFINDLVTDLMPFIEENYPVKTGRENTAITGFSMGGRESLFIGFTRPDLFGYIGATCPAPGLTPGEDLGFHPGQLEESELVFKNEEETPFFIMVSAALNDNVVDNHPEKYHDILTANGVSHVWHSITNGDHGGRGIRPHMYYFVKSIFK